MKYEKHLIRSMYIRVPALTILFIFYIVLGPETAFALAANSPVSKIKIAVQDNFDKKFREGRDLIDKEEWAQASKTFSEAIEKYPSGKSADAALYWLAFCHKKQKQFKEADAALDRLIEKFPASSWASDARVMKLEIATPVGGFNPAIANTTAPVGGMAGLPASRAVSRTRDAARTTSNLYESLTFGGGAASETRAPLDREDEIKIAAFQSLLAADPKRAIGAMGEILKPDSNASETLKLEILRVLRSPRMLRMEALSPSVSKIADPKEYAPLLQETLVKAFEREPNLKIRKEIIYSLVSLGDQSIEYLKKLYAAADNDRETKLAIINSFGNSAVGFYYFNSPAGYLHNSAAGSSRNRKIEANFLLEIVSGEKDAELRSLALANLQRFEGWAASGQTIETLARLYDADADETFKIAVVRSLSNAKQTSATRKLMNIARSDKSDKLRLEAIHSLRGNQDPEVLKFLEDLIR